VTPQSLPIPQTQVPSAPSSSLCPENTENASEADGWCEYSSLTSGLSEPVPRRYAVVFNQQSCSLCQATLSIGLYLLLEGPVPTSVFYPGRCGINFEMGTQTCPY
jgi:hypothetical protein